MPSNKYWLGGAATVSQISSCTITANDTSTTYSISIGGISVSLAGNVGGTSSTAGFLAQACAASTHPYFSMITWVANGAVITGTVKSSNAGVPFIAVSSKSGGTGTISAFTTSVVSQGPCDWSTLANWDGGTLPVNGDSIIVRNTSNSILYGLVTGITPASITIERTFSGKVGLDYASFQNSSTGGTNSNAPEYKQIYLSAGASKVDVGEYYGVGSASGSGRILIDTGSTACAYTIFGTASSASESGRCAIKILCNSASTTLNVRSASGAVCVAGEVPNEVAVIGTVSVDDTSSGSVVILGKGVTCSNYYQAGGNNFLRSTAADYGTFKIDGGVVTTEGSKKPTVATMNGGIWYPNHSDVDIAGSLVMTGGTLNLLQTRIARNLPDPLTISPLGDCKIVGDGSILTQPTTFNLPSTKYTMTFSEGN